MASSDTQVNLSRDFETNGVKLSAGIVSIDDIRKDMRITEKDGSSRQLTTVEAGGVVEDLKRREADYQRYREGITEKRDYMSRAGSISMGDGQ